LVSGKVLFELALAFDIVTSEVLLVGVVNGESAQAVKGEATSEVEGDRVLSAIVE
jgi:hypothetical protein